MLETEKYTMIITRIDSLLKKKNDVIIAIDGKCGAGKTTLGQYLRENYDASLFHMDDFFLQKRQRTEKRYQTPGGNIDYERFYDTVIKPLLKGHEVHYQKFDCQKMELDDDIEIIPYHHINIIEGTYSMHPYFHHYYDLSIVMNIPDEKQESRILKREGPKQLEMFKNKWIPLEKLYFNHLDIFSQADILLDE